MPLPKRILILGSRLYGILGVFALLATASQAVLVQTVPEAFEGLRGQPASARMLLLLGLASADQVLALCLSLLLAVLLAAFPWKVPLGRRLRVQPAALLGAALLSLGVLLRCFSQVTHVYLGAFMDLPLLLDVLQQLRQWLAYSHHADPVTLYSLLGGSVLLLAVLTWLFGRAQRGLERGPEGAAGKRWSLRAALLSLGVLGLCLPLLERLGLGMVFLHGLAPELHVVGQMLERRPPAPPGHRYPESRQQISLRQYAAQVKERPRWNVIVVAVESWTGVRTGFTGAPRLTTPNLDRLSRRSLVLPTTVAASTHSEYGQAALISSLHPLKYEHHDSYRQIPYARVLLSDVFSALGYRTAMYSSQDERWQNNVNFLFNGGWDVFWFSLHFLGPHYGEGMQTKIHDEYTVAEAIGWIRKTKDRPFFLYLNFQDTHWPYMPPKPWQGVYGPIQMPPGGWAFYRWPPGAHAVARTRNDNSLLYVDAQIGKLVEELQSSGLEDRTLLLIVGDHGENLGPGSPPSHCCRLMTAELLTPMLLHAPGRIRASVDLRPVSTLDVAPTVTGVLGLPPHPIWQGVDALAEAPEGRPIYVHSGIFAQVDAVVDWPWKLIVNHTFHRTSLTNMVLDPDETVDQLSQPGLRPELAARFREMHRRIRDFRACQLGFYADEKLYRNFYPTCE